ncbi:MULTISPECIES: preprotein translocase subunit SecG [Neptunomonas]|jgi:preprotein translocase subunit SecG|nr:MULTISPECIES: preprotein translocase subunit SecG [Neptunomonas]MDN2660827.1 preprotein translocase subunit SecG [Neptunomonas sp. CHC150]
METVVLAVHVILAAGIIALVMLQQGKGAEAGAAFGAGASQTVFGSQGSGNVLGRFTAILAAGLFVTSFVLAFYAKQQASSISDAGIPSIEEVQSVDAVPELPVLEQQQSAPVDADVPSAGE